MTFDQAMQAGQMTNFSQFTTTILRWIEDSCRPAVSNQIPLSRGKYSTVFSLVFLYSSVFSFIHKEIVYLLLRLFLL